MRSFLQKITLAAFVFAVICTSLVVGAQLLYKTASYKLPARKHIVILGDSHTECAIDDEILSSAINISQSGAGYFYSYLILNELVKHNNQIDTVILSYFDRSLSKSYDSVLYSDERYSFKLPSHLSLMTTEDLKFTNQSLQQLIAAYFEAVKAAPSFLLSNKDFRNLELGGYLKLDRHHLKQDILRYDTIEVTTEHINTSTKQATILAKIKNLCRQHDITLLLMDTPIYQVENYTNKTLFDAQRDSLLKGYQYVDYSTFQLPEYCFGDVTHLNYKGAEIFSQYLKNNGIIRK